MLEGEIYVGASRNPASQISESLRTALGGSASLPDIRQQTPTTPVLASVASISAGPAQKSRCKPSMLDAVLIPPPKQNAA
jgi:hypothetical protein